jgi:hypothetical protein
MTAAGVAGSSVARSDAAGPGGDGRGRANGATGTGGLGGSGGGAGGGGRLDGNRARDPFIPVTRG